MSGTQPARGMRDFLPEDVRRRQYVIGVIADVYQRYGFEPLETPAVENIDTLLGKYGEEGDKLIFRILKRGEGAQSGETDLALRYDLTVPLARVIAEHRAKLPKLFKRYQVQPVWRADRPQKGRFREFYQCDVDAIGSPSMIVEAELLAAAAEVFTRLGFAAFTIRLNHRDVLTGVLDAAGVPAESHGDALVALDKLDKIGHEAVAKELTERGLVAPAAARLLALFAGLEACDNVERLRRLREHVGVHDAATRGLADLEAILTLTSRTPANGHVEIDASVARGLSYYTGPVFEVAVPEFGASLGAGGRYDNLIGMFLGQQVPATGISLGLERILVVMSERGMFPAALVGGPADVLVTLWNAGGASNSLDVAAMLREAGLRVEVYPDADKLGKQFKHASSRNIPFVVVAGDDEAARGEVAVKNLASGEQTTVPRAEAATFIKSFRPA